MTDVLVLASCAAFLLFFVAGRFAPCAAMAGWTCIVFNLFSELPAFLRETNFLYPALAALSIPFLIVTIRRLAGSDPVILSLSTAAAVAVLVFVPLAFLPPLRDALVSIVIGAVFAIVTALGHQPVWYAWDTICENGFYNQIIPACTGILAIAMVLGVIAAVPGVPLRDRVIAALVTVPAIFLLNLLRVAGVFIAVSGRWFDALPDSTGTGDANFFWAHNVIAEALAVAFLVLLGAWLCRALPGLAAFARTVGWVYRDEIICALPFSCKNREP